MKKLMMVVMAMGMAAAAWADVSFSYSGQLRSETGGAVSVKNPKITFSLYGVATGGTALWSRMIPVLLDDNGYFAVELSNASGSAVGTEVALERVLAENATLFIGLEVENSSGEISPRQRLLSTPRASFAEDVRTAKQDFTVNGTAVLVNGLKIGDANNPKAEIKADGSINAASILQGGNKLIPKGVIVMWSGTTAPAGWALCNGENNTPDLRGRFVIGTGKSSVSGTTYEYGATGGEEKHALTVNEMPSHNHYSIVAKHDFDSTGADHYAWAPNKSGDSSKRIDDQHLNSENTGGNVSHENRPPYYALAYIMKM